jgi:hypothetical protein
MNVAPRSLLATLVSTRNPRTFAPSASLLRLLADVRMAVPCIWRGLQIGNVGRTRSPKYHVRASGCLMKSFSAASLLILIANCQFLLGQTGTNLGSVNIGSFSAGGYFRHHRCAYQRCNGTRLYKRRNRDMCRQHTLRRWSILHGQCDLYAEGIRDPVWRGNAH